jgi:5-methylcytosine-specific restriction endonuclease McrA
MDDQRRAKIWKELKRKESRTEAQLVRGEIINNQKGECYICGSFVPYIMEIHHIHSVAQGGSGDIDNLVGLCPNCHHVVDSCHSHMADNPHFQEWAEHHYLEAQQDKLISVAYPNHKQNG